MKLLHLPLVKSHHLILIKYSYKNPMKLLKVATVIVLSLLATKASAHVIRSSAVHSVTGQEQRVILSSHQSFDETIRSIKEALTAKGMTIFATIDHAEAARQAGLTMQPATVIVYGTPKAGTPLMIQDPYFALKLPLKVLVTENNGKVEVVFDKAEDIIKGTQIPFSAVENTLKKAESVIKQALPDK